MLLWTSQTSHSFILDYPNTLPLVPPLQRFPPETTSFMNLFVATRTSVAGFIPVACPQLSLPGWRWVDFGRKRQPLIDGREPERTLFGKYDGLRRITYFLSRPITPVGLAYVWRCARLTPRGNIARGRCSGMEMGDKFEFVCAQRVARKVVGETKVGS